MSEYFASVTEECGTDCPWFNAEAGECDKYAKEEEGTCCVVSFDDGVGEDCDGNFYRYDLPTYELSCDHVSFGYAPPHYCPDCGAKVVL